MGRTKYKRASIKQHRDLLQEQQYAFRVEKNKKKEHKNNKKHPKRSLYEDWFEGE